MNSLTRLTSIILLSGALVAAAGRNDTNNVLPEGDSEPARRGELSSVEPQSLSARDILDGTLARLPGDPVSLRGTMIVRRQRGVVLHEVPFEVDLAWGASPSTATYRLLDTFGRDRGGLSLVLHPGGTAEHVWHGSIATPPAGPPNLVGSILDTDVTWMDLSMAFLWWPEARLDGERDFRGAACDLVIVRPPAPIPGCGGFRLWIDRKLGLMRQAEQLDEQDEVVRRMWVSSVGKIGERWMIRNMEVECPGSLQRTKIHIDDLDTP